MILKRFRVTNFRSVIDSGWINCDEVTTLVGVNESGKSNILLALWKLNPAREGAIDVLHDLPVTQITEYRNQGNKIHFVEAVFELDNNVNEINDKLGAKFLPTDELHVSRNYDGEYCICFDNEQAQKKLLGIQKSKKINEEKMPGMSLNDIIKIIKPFLPTFVYYSNYGNLTSRIYLPYAIKWLKHETIPGIDMKEDQIRTIRVLFDYVNLKPEEILELGKDPTELARERGTNQLPNEKEINKAKEAKEKRSLLLQSAGTKLTTDFREWWKQGDYKFRFDADGSYFYIWVSDDKRPEEVDLSLRSTGLQWFFSFYLVFLMECKGINEGAVLLLDEAGLTLHPLAQRDLANFFALLAKENQIINTTHSPFIIDPENINQCRVVYTDEKGKTVVSEDLRKGSGEVGEKSVYAVHAALGLTVSDIILQGCQVVAVEGASDQYYLSAIKNVLIRESKIAPKREIVFAPSGGVKGVQGIVSIIASKDEQLPMVLLDSDKSGENFRKKLEDGLYASHKEHIISIQDITGMEHSEVEDLIPYDFISKAITRLLGEQDDDDEFEPVEDKPILPQIEDYASQRGIELKNGWKVEVAKAFKKSISGKKNKRIPEKYTKMWIKLFERLNEE